MWLILYSIKEVDLPLNYSDDDPMLTMTLGDVLIDT